jgi:ubiquinone/menaquinone biosynthesis C-methylase UbiE
MNNRLFNASMAKRLDDPKRLLWLPPAAVLDALAIQPGDAIADIGAGTGYFSFPMAHAAGPLGQIYAVDSQAEMLEHLQHKFDTENISNIHVVRTEADSTGLPAASCNLVFLANAWHEITDRAAVLIEAKRILKSRGKVAILD